MSKQYGLILAGSKGGGQPPKANFTKPSIFGSESDSEDDGPKKLASIGPGSLEKRRARRIQEKALEEDPTIFQYDELYDDIETKRTEEKMKTKESRQPKYINRLLQYAEKRKIENERRLERAVQREREKEEGQFEDKESFVTSSYRKKLEELRKAEEQEKREDYLEAIGDVTKQQDLGGFYRHLYEQKLQLKEEKEKDKEGENEKKVDKEIQEPEPSSSKVQIKTVSKSRAYRKRNLSDAEETEPENRPTEDVSKKAHLQSNLDADSDFSIDDSSSSASSDEDDDDDGQKKKKDESNREKQSTAASSATANGTESEGSKPAVLEIKKEVDGSSDAISTDVKNVEIKEEKMSDDEKKVVEKSKTKSERKKDIWKKRTVGDVFDAALQRYYERKSARYG